MYSPKIGEGLIPVLYQTAKQREMPMTRLVDRLLMQALAHEELPINAREPFLRYSISQSGRADAAELLPREDVQKKLSEMVGVPFSSEYELRQWHKDTLSGFNKAVTLAFERRAVDGFSSHSFEPIYPLCYQAIEEVVAQAKYDLGQFRREAIP